ncbi:MAG: CoA pyrophosphatase [Myxococcota bacterium]
MPSLAQIQSALADVPVDTEPPGASIAAVALAFAGPPDALDLCFILRASRAGDRWSGQMAFPGGKADPEDATPQAVAIREAREEVDLHLDQARPLGALPPVPLRPSGALGILMPFAFYVGTERPPLRPNDGEVDAAYWIPIADLWDESRMGTIEWEWKGQMHAFPGIRFREHLIWGLTYKVLISWGKLLGKPLPDGHLGVGPRPGQR